MKATTENLPVVSEQSTDGFTVPSGEVWRGTLMGAGSGVSRNDGISVNGTPVLTGNTDTDSAVPMASNAEVTLVGGDEVSLDFGENEGVAFQGYEVSDFMDNDPVSVQLDLGESVTVPSDEVWSVTLTSAYSDTGRNETVHINDVHVLNGNTETNSTAMATGVAWVVLDGGDEISMSDSADIGGCGIFGWVVSE